MRIPLDPNFNHICVHLGSFSTQIGMRDLWKCFFAKSLTFSFAAHFSLSCDSVHFALSTNSLTMELFQPFLWLFPLNWKLHPAQLMPLLQQAEEKDSLSRVDCWCLVSLWICGRDRILDAHQSFEFGSSIYVETESGISNGHSFC